MNACKKPCDRCTQPVCDYRRCAPYRKWIKAAWAEFQRYGHQDCWMKVPQNDGKFVYIHPDMIRKYLQQSPCDRCEHASNCDMPCLAYWNWWDARAAWLRWKLQHADI